MPRKVDYYGTPFAPASELVRASVKMLFGVAVWAACIVIAAVTKENVPKGCVTVRKIWRIRKLTGLKLWFYEHFGRFCRYIEIDDYMRYIERRFNADYI